MPRPLSNLSPGAKKQTGRPASSPHRLEPLICFSNYPRTTINIPPPVWRRRRRRRTRDELLLTHRRNKSAGATLGTFRIVYVGWNCFLHALHSKTRPVQSTFRPSFGVYTATAAAAAATRSGQPLTSLALLAGDLFVAGLSTWRPAQSGNLSAAVAAARKVASSERETTMAA